MKLTKVLLAAAAVTTLSTAAVAGTLDDVKSKGSVQCGVTTGLAGFAAPNDAGEWAGFDVDVSCSATAVTEGSRAYTLYTIESVARRGVLGSPGYVKRRITATAAF